MALFVYYWDNINTIDNLFDYVELNTINNNNYIINNNIHNNSDNNNNDNNTKTYCTNNVCKMKRTGYEVNDIRLIPNGKLVTTLLALIIINVVIISLFVDIIFTMSIYAVLSLRLALFELASFKLALSTISLWLMVNFNEHTLDFDQVAAIEQIIMAYSDYVQGYLLSFYAR